MRTFIHLAVGIVAAVAIGVGGLMAFGSTHTISQVAKNGLHTPCFYGTSERTDRISITIKNVADEHAIAELSCAGFHKASTYRLTESLEIQGRLVATAKTTFKGYTRPYGPTIVSISPFAPNRLPVVLVMFGCGSACSYQLFGAKAGRLFAIRLSATYSRDSGSDLAGGDAALHGEGITCRAAPRERLVIRQTFWYPIEAIRWVKDPGGGESVAPEEKVEVKRSEWILGGSPVHQIAHKDLPQFSISYKEAQPLGDVNCNSNR